MSYALRLLWRAIHNGVIHPLMGLLDLLSLGLYQPMWLERLHEITAGLAGFVDMEKILYAEIAELRDNEQRWRDYARIAEQKNKVQEENLGRLHRQVQRANVELGAAAEALQSADRNMEALQSRLREAEGRWREALASNHSAELLGSLGWSRSGDGWVTPDDRDVCHDEAMDHARRSVIAGS